MSQNTRKIIGTILLIALVVLYALVATAIAVAQLADASGFVQMMYFLLTGFLWVVPAMFIIKWMLKP